MYAYNTYLLLWKVVFYQLLCIWVILCIFYMFYVGGQKQRIAIARAIIKVSFFNDHYSDECLWPLSLPSVFSLCGHFCTSWHWCSQRRHIGSCPSLWVDNFHKSSVLYGLNSCNTVPLIHLLILVLYKVFACLRNFSTYLLFHYLFTLLLIYFFENRPISFRGQRS